MALTDALKADFNAPYRDGELTPVPVAAGEYIPAGTIVCISETGYAAGGQAATGLTYVGRAEAFVDNTSGADGAVTVLVRRKKAFRWLNDGTVTQAMLGRRVYVLDNRTLTGTEDGHSKAGVVILLDDDGVWIE